MRDYSKKTLFAPSRAPSHRRLKVGEEVRHILSSLLLHAKLPEPGLPVSVTITQVQMSPDLQIATLFVMPLGGQMREETLAHLSELAGYLRHQLGKRLSLKFTPSLRFRIDESFDEAERIEKLLNSIAEKN